MAAAGGHWVKGSFIPSERVSYKMEVVNPGQPGEFGEFGYFVNPRSWDDYANWAEEIESGGWGFGAYDTSEKALLFAGRQPEEHIQYLEEYAERKGFDPWDVEASSVRFGYSVVNEKPAWINFYTSSAGVIDDYEGAMRNIYRTMDKLSRVDGFRGVKVRIEDHLEGKPEVKTEI